MTTGESVEVEVVMRGGNIEVKYSKIENSLIYGQTISSFMGCQVLRVQYMAFILDLLF